MIIMDKATIGKYLRTARERAGLSMNKVATKMGTGYERVKALEEGQGNYGIDTLLAYGKAVGVAFIAVDEAAVTAVPPIVVEKEKHLAAPVNNNENENAGEVKKKKKIIIEEA